MHVLCRKIKNLVYALHKIICILHIQLSNIEGIYDGNVTILPSYFVIGVGALSSSCLRERAHAKYLNICSKNYFAPLCRRRTYEIAADYVRPSK